jgi:argininosuccinate lyase
MPFRDTYRIVGAEVTALLDRHEDLPVESQEQLVARLQARNHLGGAGNLGLEQAQQRLEHAQTLWNQRAATFTTSIQHLIGTENVASTEGEK